MPLSLRTFARPLQSTLLLILLCAPCFSEDAASPQDQKSPPPLRYPKAVTRFDLATPDDLRFSYFLEALLLGDVPGNWGLLQEIPSQVGTWVNQFLDASKIASIITSGMQVEGQSPVQAIDVLVEDCAKLLNVPKPHTHIRNHYLQMAYVVQTHDRTFLVLTSAMLNLYENRPDELRFIIGRELGHLKCDHVRIKRAAYGILSAINSINLAVVPTEFQSVLPTLALGRLFNWTRESEISADRAGLLCCQDPQVAYQALTRLLHGLSADSTWIDPNHPEFDADKICRDFQQWQNEPFLKFVTYFQKFNLESPFIPERIASLKSWASSPQYEAILSRATGSEGQLSIVRSLQIDGIGSQSKPLHIFFKASDGRKPFLISNSAQSSGNSKWTDFNSPVECLDGQPLYFEVWEDQLVSDRLLGGFVVYPRLGVTKYTVSFDWDWNTRSGISTPVVVELMIDFSTRAQ